MHQTRSELKFLPSIFMRTKEWAYASDKDKAGTVYWRTPEKRLHLLEMLCGWPGALVAQWHIRHKNRKASYQTVFWLIVIFHLITIARIIAESIQQGQDETDFYF